MSNANAVTGCTGYTRVFGMDLHDLRQDGAIYETAIHKTKSNNIAEWEVITLSEMLSHRKDNVNMLATYLVEEENLTLDTKVKMAIHEKNKMIFVHHGKFEYKLFRSKIMKGQIVK